MYAAAVRLLNQRYDVPDIADLEMRTRHAEDLAETRLTRMREAECQLESVCWLLDNRFEHFYRIAKAITKAKRT